MNDLTSFSLHPPTFSLLPSPTSSAPMMDHIAGPPECIDMVTFCVKMLTLSLSPFLSPQDIIDTGGTMCKLLELLKQYEPANVRVAR